MRKLLDRNSIIAGVLLTLASEVSAALLVLCVLLIGRIGLYEHLRWFGAAFVPPLLLLRHYAKGQSHPLTLKGVICTFFVTFVAFMWMMLKNHYITF